MGLVLKHVVQTKSGSFHYRRRVPERLKGVVGVTEFKRFLGKTQNEALANYPNVHTECERLFRSGERKPAGQSPLSEKAMSELQAHYHLIKRLQDLGFDPFRLEYDAKGYLADQIDREVTADAIIDS